MLIGFSAAGPLCNSADFLTFSQFKHPLIAFLNKKKLFYVDSSTNIVPSFVVRIKRVSAHTIPTQNICLWLFV